MAARAAGGEGADPAGRQALVDVGAAARGAVWLLAR